jgi:hypothetical protein
MWWMGARMSEKTDKLILDLIKQHYRPYDTHEEFRSGFRAYQAGHLGNPHNPGSISAQAWDCGKAAMHYSKATAA